MSNYHMRGQWLFSAMLVALVGLLGSTPQGGYANAAFYDVRAFACLMAVCGVLVVMMLASAFRKDRRPAGNTEPPIFDGTLFVYAFIACSAAAAIEDARLWMAGFTTPGLLVAALALILCAATAFVRRAQEREGFMTVGDIVHARGYALLVCHYALLPVAVVPTAMLFATAGRVSPFWMTPVSDLWPLGIASTALFAQFVWATELDHAATRRQPNLHAVGGSKIAA
jgi:hypothetical protein